MEISQKENELILEICYEIARKNGCNHVMSCYKDSMRKCCIHRIYKPTIELAWGYYVKPYIQSEAERMFNERQPPPPFTIIDKKLGGGIRITTCT